MAGLVTDYMQAYGTSFAWKCVPKRVDKLTSGLLQVTWTDTSSGQERRDTYDSVLWAVGEWQCRLDLENPVPLTALMTLGSFNGSLAARKQELHKIHTHSLLNAAVSSLLPHCTSMPSTAYTWFPGKQNPHTTHHPPPPPINLLLVSGCFAAVSR